MRNVYSRLVTLTLTIAAAFLVASCGNRIGEKESMEFLYRYMDIADQGDYSEEFFRENVKMSLQARREMPWGKDVPDQLFRHFVLPVRVNNERLDDFRKVYYDTLKIRVAGLSMHDAALEINHWCHEKATYTPSDGRTSSPMATILNGEGRCGEESTFTVAAMRTMGIPARQVYTPRWAHTDDNHAWVEVWTDGKWSFLGACEPEPELNMAWFNEPASRAMLMHTRVFGDYNGQEDVIRRTPNFTEINVIGNYVKTRDNVVTVKDIDGNVVSGAKVDFCIYNYGEVFPAVTLAADNEGKASLHTGLGDMMVWAYSDGNFGYAKLEGDGPECRKDIVLSHKVGDPLEIVCDINPPAPGNIPAHATAEAVEANKVRLAAEDSIRHAYTSTFTTSDNAEERLGLPELSKENADKACRQLIDAKGNWREVQKFIAEAYEDGKVETALPMLATLTRKDLRDTKSDVLKDALESVDFSAEDYPDAELFYKYVLCPRVAGEFIQPYRRQIREVLTQIAPDMTDAEKTASVINWAKENLEIADSLNSKRLQATPAGVLSLRKSDRRSRDIFTVAALRTFGIPARIDQMTGKAQYFTGGEWNDIVMGAGNQVGTVSEKGWMTMRYKPETGMPENPEYYRHFTLAKILKNGRRVLLDFEGGDATELGADASAKSFSKPFQLDEGNYVLTSGTRMASGKVLARMVTFNVLKDQTTDVQLVMRHSAEEISVLGAMNPEAFYIPVSEGKAADKVSLLSTTGRGYFLLAVLGAGDEPSNHAIREMQAVAGKLKEWGRPVVVLGQNEAAVAKLNVNKDWHYGIDPEWEIREMLCEGCHTASRTLPVIAMCDSFGRVVYISTGYNTSLASQLTAVIDGI